MPTQEPTQFDQRIDSVLDSYTNLEVLELLALAEQAAIKRNTKSTVIDVSDLAVAFAIEIQRALAPSAYERLIDIPSDFHAAFKAAVADQLTLDTEGFESLAAELRELVPANPGRRQPETSSTPYASRVSDQPAPDSDALGLRPDAKALADLICLKVPRPPLAIGLFGDWGAGKSTFMAMIEAEADKTSSLERLSFETDRTRTPLFVQNIVHIRFNAWHYTEADLWSSLAAHIFRSLFEQANEKDSKRPSWMSPEAFGALLEDLAKARAIGNQAEGNTRDARMALAEAEVAAGKAKRQRDLLAGAATGDPNALVGLLKTPEGRQSLSQVLNDAGIDQDLSALKRAADIVQDGANQLTGLGRWAKAVFSSDGFQGFAFWVVFVGGCLLVLDHSLEGFNLGLLASSLLSGTTASLAAGLGALARVGDATSKLRSFSDRLNTAATETYTVAETALIAAQSRLDEAEVALQQAQQRRAGLEALADINNPEAALDAFLEDRLGNGSYRDQLGVVSRLHDDFEALSELIRANEDEWDKSREAALDNGIGPKSPPHLQRIVLYIDDLDRCPNPTVVRVLEAVHLLLALPLFAVVVGVDSRWLETALERQYEQQLGKNGIASPSDYLEKIFQLPYWLPKLETSEPDDSDPSTAGTKEITFKSLVKELVPELRQTPGGGANRTQNGTPTDNTPAAPSRGGGTIEWRKPEQTAVEKHEAIREQVKITQDEVDCITAFAPLIGKSPRAVKRFMNSYRFLKALGVVDENRFAPTIVALSIEIGACSDTHDIWRRADDFINICMSASDTLLKALDNAPEALGQRDADLIAEFGNVFEDDHQQWQQDIKKIGDALKRLPDEQQASVQNALRSYESAHALTRLTFRRPY